MEHLRELLARMQVSIEKLIQAKIIVTAISMVVFLVGFYLIKIEHWILLGLFVGIIDALPFIGGGIILLPWSILAILQSNSSLALSLIVLFIISFLLHQILEPLLIGKEVGIKPLYSFIIMIGSMMLFGPWGAIIGSILTVFLSAVLSMRKYRANQ